MRRAIGWDAAWPGAESLYCAAHRCSGDGSYEQAGHPLLQRLQPADWPPGGDCDRYLRARPYRREPHPGPAGELFQQTCSVCHAQGIAGAPRAGDKAAWAPRIAAGKAKLYEHALKGFTGSAGMMPPKGGRMDAPDDLVKQAVDQMVQMSQ
jgi:cytochrome c5